LKEGDKMEIPGLIVSVIAVVVSAASLLVARLADARSKKAEDVKNLLGEKETVAFGALKLLRDGFPPKAKERTLLVRALMQATILERSDRARALLYRVIDENRAALGAEFNDALLAIEGSFASMDAFGFGKELDLSRGERLAAMARKVVDGREEKQVR
jgi:hypothetical protein